MWAFDQSANRAAEVIYADDPLNKALFRL